MNELKCFLRGVSLGSFGFHLFSLSIAAPLTTRLLHPPTNEQQVHMIFFSFVPKSDYVLKILSGLNDGHKKTRESLNGPRRDFRIQNFIVPGADSIKFYGPVNQVCSLAGSFLACS